MWKTVNFNFLRISIYQIFAVLKIDASIIPFPCLTCHFHHCHLNKYTFDIYLSIPIKAEESHMSDVVCINHFISY